MITIVCWSSRSLTQSYIHTRRPMATSMSYTHDLSRKMYHSWQGRYRYEMTNTTRPCACLYLLAYIHWTMYSSQECGASRPCLRSADHTPSANTGGTLRWRHNGHNSVSNHQPHHCLLNCLFRRRSKKTSKLSVTGLCVGNSPGTGEFPAQMAGYAENVTIWWRHHE